MNSVTITSGLTGTWAAADMMPGTARGTLHAAPLCMMATPSDANSRRTDPSAPPSAAVWATTALHAFAAPAAQRGDCGPESLEEDPERWDGLS